MGQKRSVDPRTLKRIEKEVQEWAREKLKERIETLEKGKEIRRRRKALRLTQLELGILARVTPPTISNIERNYYASSKVIGKIEKILDQLERQEKRGARKAPRRSTKN